LLAKEQKEKLHKELAIKDKFKMDNVGLMVMHKIKNEVSI
jgi:hypothetical protein